MHRRHMPQKRIPTALLPERGLRDSEDLLHPPCAATALRDGRAAGHRQAVLGKRCWKVLPLCRSPSRSKQGGGGSGRRTIALRNLCFCGWLLAMSLDPQFQSVFAPYLPIPIQRRSFRRAYPVGSGGKALGLTGPMNTILNIFQMIS